MNKSHIYDFFSTVIAPLSTDVFLDEYWQQAPILLRGNQEKLTDMFGQEDIRSWVMAILRESHTPIMYPDTSQGQPVTAYVQLQTVKDALTENLTGTGRAEDIFSLPVSLQRASEYMAGEVAEGMLAISAPHRLDARLMDLTSRLCCVLRQPGGVHTYFFYHSHAGKGRGLHFDSDETFFFQLFGTRTFRVSSSPIKRHPPFAASLASDDSWRGVSGNEPVKFSVPPPANVEMHEYKLSPGDILYFPGGTVHETYTEEGNSLGYALSVTPTTKISFLRDFVSSGVNSESLRWRASVQIGKEEQVTELLEELLELNREGDNVNFRVRDELLMRAAQPTGRLIRPVPKSDLKTGGLTLNTCLYCHPEKRFIIDRERYPESVHIYIDDHILEFAESRLFKFAEGLATFREFLVSECLAWDSPAYDLSEVKGFLESLIRLECLVVRHE